ncbi:MAG TPA: aldolase catalytic domain-containing protein [Lacipirellulaceae bacterium]|nr:aldolase catalytic domain-containing protein [Lacipirellulaceae bacterium]
MTPVNAPWITYRPQLKVLDCTIRDGGLINNHQFDEKLVRAVYEACVEAGIDYMEVGYKNSPRLHSRKEFGPCRFCDEDMLNRLFADHDAAKTGLKLTAMADAGKSDWREQIVPRAESKLDMIRVAFYAQQVSEAVEMIEYCHELGYETSANLMAVSNVKEVEIDTVLAAIAPTHAQVMCIVDSFGHMYREQIDHLYNKYSTALADSGKEIGIHAHNNMQLAFANTIEAIILGANRVDATMGGLGRGAGNCPMELLLGFLRNPKFRLRPVIRLLQDHIEPLRATVEWGPLVPYNITGQMNLHPRAAMQFRASKEKDDYIKFYDQVVADI